MAGVVAANVIGVVASGLGIVSFARLNFPQKPPARGATIQVKIGQPKKHAEPQLDGEIKHVYAWDVNNYYLGQADGNYLRMGDSGEYTVDSYSGGARAEYVGVAAGNDGVCVAWISVTMADGTTPGAWTGDIGYKCGQYWYEQTETAGKMDASKSDSKPYIPRCTWLDKDHSNGIPSAALKFKTTAYGDRVTETVKNSLGCKSTRWGKDSGPIRGEPKKRAERERLPWMEQQLVVSQIEQHKAENMCNSTTSWGPDFVSPDGMFCDMGTKTLIPLCSKENVPGCISLDEEKKTLKKRAFIAKRAVDADHKTYEHINNWR